MRIRPASASERPGTRPGTRIRLASASASARMGTGPCTRIGLASAPCDSSLRVFAPAARSGSDYRQYDNGHDGPVATAMCYPMPDGSHVIISCGKDHKIVVWDLETIKQLYSIEVTELGHAKNVGYHISKDHIQVGCASMHGSAAIARVRVHAFTHAWAHAGNLRMHKHKRMRSHCLRTCTSVWRPCCRAWNVPLAHQCVRAWLPPHLCPCVYRVRTHCLARRARHPHSAPVHDWPVHACMRRRC